MPSDLFMQAVELFQQGQQIEAENLLIAGVGKSKETHGTGSAEFAQANYELGSLLQAMQRLPAAIEALRVACSVSIPDDHGATKNRLTYLMQLGELQEQAGELDEAEKMLRKSLELREDFYGREHAGYGFGLEPLASVLMKKGKFDEAFQTIEATIDNFWMTGHPRVSTAFPLRSLILFKSGKQQQTFVDLDDVPDNIVTEMVSAAVDLVEVEDPVSSQKMLDELLHFVEPRLGKQNPAVINLQTMLVNVSGQVGQSEGRLETIEKVIAAHRSNGNEKEAIVAVLGLAHAYGELGNNQKCEEEYRNAFKQAKTLKDLALQSQCLRNLGLFYSEQDRIPDAEKTLKMAAKAGQESNDETMFGRSLVALGIFLQHNSKLNDARKYLVQGVELLEQTDPDGVCGRSHLNAIENDLSCGCGDTSAAICEALRQEILNEVPEGYLSNVNVSLGDDGIQIGIEGARDLNEEEVNLVGRIVQQAQIDFRKRLEERS